MLEKNSNKFFNKLPRLFFISVVPTCKIYCKKKPSVTNPFPLPLNYTPSNVTSPISQENNHYFPCNTISFPITQPLIPKTPH